MPSWKLSKGLLERQVSKTIIRYIDSAITSPPKHQPFQKDDHDFFHLFSSFWKEDFSGIDLDDGYERKSDDPSWLSCYSDHAINSVRLVLAVCERDMTYVLVEVQSAPPPDLDSVSLKNLSRETFGNILRGLDEANKQLKHSEKTLAEEVNSRLVSLHKESCDDQVSDRFYEEFKLAYSKVGMHQQYDSLPDDPDWLSRFSNQAINVVRLVMLLRAQNESAKSVLHSSSVQELSLDNIALKNLPLEQFLDIFRQLVDAAKRTKWNKVGNSLDIIEPPGSDTVSEDEESEQFHDAEDAHALSEIDFVGSDSTLNDLEENIEDEIVEFGSEDDFKRELEKWDVHEALEDLPEDVIGPLLDAPKARKMTVTILRRALGVKGSTNTAIKRNLRRILHELRREYRIAQTPPFLYGTVSSYQRPITLLIYGYLVLSSSSYVLRSHCRPIRRTPKTPTASNLLTGLDMIKRDLMAIVDDLKGFPEFQEVMLDRVRTMNIRFDIYQDTISHCMEIGSVLKAIYTLEGPANKPHIALQHENCKELWAAIEVFMQFDEAMLDKEHFQEFPGCLVKACGIMTLLRDIIDLKYLPACAQNEYLIKAVDGAKALLRKWRQRSINSENSLYVPLQHTDTEV